MRPFDTHFGPLRNDIQARSKEVKEEIRLALHQATHQEQQLQLLERKAAGGHRSLSEIFLKKADRVVEEEREWRVQRDLRASSKKASLGLRYAN